MAGKKLIPRYKVKASFPGMKDQYMIEAGDIIMDDGYRAVRNHNGHPVRPINWDEYPHLFEKIEPCTDDEYEASIVIWVNEK